MQQKSFSFFRKEYSGEGIYLSVQQHLQWLLNARQGSLLHLPDYGLPDVSEIYQSLPYSVNYFIGAIARTIEKYEPRLTKVSIRPKQTEIESCIIQLEIHADLQENSKVKFDSYFFSDRKTIVGSVNYSPSF